MAHPTPTFEIIVSIPHYNFSASGFPCTVHTIPFKWISTIIDLLSSNPLATHDLLIVDQINQTILNDSTTNSRLAAH